MIGMSNDYVMYRKAQPVFYSRLLQWSFVGALVGGILGGIAEVLRRPSEGEDE
jgi:hypothetical protein